MKKLIAISVMLALVAGAAFAQTSVSGVLELQWGGIIKSMNNGDDVGMGGISIGDSNIQLSSSNDDGTFSALLRYRGANFPGPVSGNSVPADGWNELHNRAFIIWRPIDQLELFFGKDGDGKFNTAGLSRWGHHRGTRGVGVENWDAQNYLLGNWDAWGFAASIKPVDMFALHVALDLPGAELFEDRFDRIQVQAALNLDFGKIDITYQGEKMGDRIGLTFSSGTLVEGLQFEVGGNYGLTSEVIRFGLGVHYNGGDWGVRARVFGGDFDNLLIKADIMPFYAFDFGTAFLNIRIVSRDGADLGWHVNPYLVLNAGPAQLRVGALIQHGDGDGGASSATKTSWSIPIGMVYSF